MRRTLAALGALVAILPAQTATADTGSDKLQFLQSQTATPQQVVTRGVTPTAPVAGTPQTLRNGQPLPPNVQFLQDADGNPTIPFVWSTGVFR